MPVSTSVDSNCSYCRDSGGPCESHSAVKDPRWTVRLDRDLLHYLLAIYPAWFENSTGFEMEQEGGTGDKSEDSSSSSESESSASPSGPALSPPRVDDSPLQKSMDRNKQSLKVKLMMRRPYMQLVDQGIMPPLKTPASFHEQRQKLQRAKMGDLLKHKIQHRPDRTELIRQHILEADTGKVDPSLAERQRMLKRARLADALNDQLSHRPGPLELIQKNILHTDENVERAVKEGQIPFRATCEGSAVRPAHPFRYVTPEGDDSSSESALSPSQEGSLDGCSTASGAAGASGGAAAACPSPATVASSPSSLSSVASPFGSSTVEPSPPPPPPPPPLPAQTKVEQQQPPPPPPPPPPPSSLVASTSGAQVVVKTAQEIAAKNRNRKKSKQKSPPKPRTIKFHEYKGPPNAQKQVPAAPSEVETSYELLLQQQQLFLQWQLEWQHKYPQIILPAKANGVTAVAGEAASSVTTFRAAAPASSAASATAPPSSSAASAPSPAPSSGSGTSAVAAPTHAETSTNGSIILTVSRNSGRLEEMKVSDLKAELKKRNLPVSGSKPQLIERLRPFVGDDGTLASSRSVSRRGSQSQLQQQQPMATDDGPLPSPPPPPSNASRRISCGSLDGSVSSFRTSTNGEMLLPSLSPASSAASCSMSPSPPSVRPPSVVNMDMDIEMNDANTLDAVDVKLGSPPTPPPLPSASSLQTQQQSAEQQIDDLVRGLQEEQRVLLEQQQILRQQAAASVIEEQQQQQQQQQQALVNTNDPKVQQRLLLQQHLQLKIHQQQIQQQLDQLQQLQQQAPAATTTSSNAQTNKMSGRATNRSGRARLTSSRSATQLSSSAAQSNSDKMADQDSSSNQRPPPPNYSEASRMLQQPSASSTSAKPRVSIKSQLVDDVLDILIRNGELPPSAAHDPVTPTTVPRDPPPLPPPLPTHLLSQQQQQNHPAVTASEIKFPYIDINELGLNLDLDSLGEAMELGVYDNHTAALQQQPQPLQPNAPPPSTSSTSSMLSTSCPEGGRSDEVTAMEMDMADWLDTLLPPLGGSQCLPISSAGSSASSSTSSSTSGFSSLGSDQHPHPYLLHHNPQQVQQQHPPNSSSAFASHNNQQEVTMNPLAPSPQLHHQHISGDPLFSSLSSDPYTDLFSLEDSDMKLPVGPLGNTLSWDRLDFTA